MTMLVNYKSKKALKAAVGQKLIYRETSMFGEEFKADGTFAVAYRPSIWKHANGGREFFAQVTMSNGLIAKVE
jgi:hypothetical protein